MIERAVRYGLLFLATLTITLIAAGEYYVVYGQPRADVAVVLAVDVSGSINDERFRLQREGLAQAVEGLSDVIGRQKIELAVLEWTSDSQVIVPWTALETVDDVHRVAGLLRSEPRSGSMLTDVGLGISAATDLMAAAPVRADRQVIDVSGDGTQNSGDLPASRARDLAVAQGIVINGLPILGGGEANLETYYEQNVVGGDQHFMIAAKGFDDFARAMQHKLALEVAVR